MADVIANEKAFCETLDTMTGSISSARESIQKLASRLDTLDTKEGISLLSLKNDVLLSYIQSLVLITSHRVLGHSLQDKAPPSEPFGSFERGTRGSDAGDLVDSMVEGRVVLEKIKVLESKMKYQIEKLLRLAEGTASGRQAVTIDDPLAFKPNPSNFVDDQPSEASDEEVDQTRDDVSEDGNAVYRPPRLAPVPYTEGTTKSRKNRSAPIPSALQQISYMDPHTESTSGLGNNTANLQSSRAKELARMTEFEEENFTRLIMKKKESKRRLRDEADIALGGTGNIGPGTGRRRGGGLEDEFMDVLKSVGRRREAAIGDGYEELRRRSKKSDALTRSRARTIDEIEGATDGPARDKKRGRFETERRTTKRRLAGKIKR